MSKSCPVGPEWTNLVKELHSEADARLAYAMFQKSNSEGIPSLDEAKELLGQATLLDKDEQLAMQSDAFKIKKSDEQTYMLNTILNRTTNPAQRTALEKLLLNTYKHRKSLEENVARLSEGKTAKKAISVSSFIGGSKFQGNADEYEAFRRFGNFNHDILERLQMESIIDNKPIAELFSREMFDREFENFNSRTPINIDNLDPDLLYSHTKNLVEIIAGYSHRQSIIIPEITIMGKSSTGSDVVGRLDLLAIDVNGNTQVLDFKTKRSQLLMQKDILGNYYQNFEKTLAELGNNKYNISRDVEGTAPAFLGVEKSRSTYDAWMVQLDTYGNMLGQAGLNVTNKSIATLIYSVDDNTNEYRGGMVHEFNNQDYYEQTLNANVNKSGFWFYDDTYRKSVLDGWKEAVDEAMPIDPDKKPVTKEEKDKQAEKNFEFNPSDTNMERIVDLMSDIAEGQLKVIHENINDLDSNNSEHKALINMYNARIQTINTFQGILVKQASNPNALIQSTNFFSALSTVANDIEVLSETSAAAMKVFSETNDVNRTKNQLKEVHQAFLKANQLELLVKAIESVVNEASENPDNNITADSEVRKKISKIYSNVESIDSAFRRIALQYSIEIFKTPGEEVYGKVKEQLKQSVQPKLDLVNKQITKLEETGSLGFLSDLKNSIWATTSKLYKENVLKDKDADTKAQASKLHELQVKKIKYEAILEGFEYSDKMIQNYIESVTNPDSIMYMGSTKLFNEDTLLQGWNQLEGWIASASNSERAVSTPVMMMKNTQSQAFFNTMNDKSLTNVDKLKNELLKSNTLEELNAKISSRRDVVFYNSVTGEKDTKNMMFLAKPFSQEYESKFRELNINKRILVKEYWEAKAKTQEAFRDYKNDVITKDQYDAIREEELDKKKQKEANSKEYIDFIVENSNVPYHEDYYKIQSMLPEDIRDEMQELYMDIEQILFQVGGQENIIELDENDFDMVKEIDVEIKKLREKAKKDNPQYAKYLDRFNELYEYDLNDKYFNSRQQDAITNLGMGSEKYNKWEKENMVERPTAEWYAERNALYEKREALTANFKSIHSEELLDLFDERARITRPYKFNGRIQPKYMTSEDIHAYDKIEADIETVMDKIKAEPSNKVAMRAVIPQLKQINLELTKLEQKQLSPVYKEEFETRYNALEKSWALVETQEGKRRIAKKNHKANSTTENLNILKEADGLLGLLADQFEADEAEFTEWFEENHSSEYKSVRDGADLRGNKTPKNFNLEVLPNKLVADQYMEKVPNPKYYKIKKLRKENWYYNPQGVTDLASSEHLSSLEIEEFRDTEGFSEEAEIAAGRLVVRPGAYNPDFHKGPDGVLLPKGIQYDGDNTYSVIPGYENNPNIDPQFKAIKADSKTNEFYNALSKLYFGLQSQIEGKKIGYQIPGYAATLVEKIAGSDSVAQVVKDESRLFLDKHFKVKGQQDVIDNTFGDMGARIRMRYATQLPEGMQSEDTISSIMKYSVEAHYNIAMQEVVPMAEGYLEYLRALKKDLDMKVSSGDSYGRDPVTGESKLVNMKERVKELNSIIDIVSFENRKYVYGQADAMENRAVKKIINGIFQYTSFIRIGFDVSNQIKNNVAGNVQALIAAGGYGGDHYSRKNWAVGKKKLFKEFLPNYWKDYGKLSDLEVSTMLYRFYNPVQKDPMSHFKEIGGGKKRRMASKLTSLQELGYLLQDKGESEIGITVMYAIMDRYTFPVIKDVVTDSETGEKTNVYELDEKGNKVRVPVHQIYIKNSDGTLGTRADVEFSTNDENMIRNIIFSEMRRAQGNYAKSDMTKFEQEVLGKMIFYFRKFLVPMFINRFGYLRPNYEAAEVGMGYWRAVLAANKIYGTGATMKQFVLGSKNTSVIKSALENVMLKERGNEDTDNPKSDMTDFYVRKIAQARRDAIAMAILSMLGMMALAYVRKKDDEDEELSILEGNAFRVLWGVKGEALAMFPVGGGSEEYIRNFTTAIPFVREATKISKMAGHAWKYGMAMAINGGEEPDPDYDGEYYQEVYKDAFYTKKNGPYEKGDPKMIKDLVDLTGIRNFRDLFNPENRIDQMKRNQ